MRISDKRRAIVFQLIYASCFIGFSVSMYYAGDWIYWDIYTKHHVTEYMCETLEASAFTDPSICDD